MFFYAKFVVKCANHIVLRSWGARCSNAQIIICVRDFLVDFTARRKTRLRERLRIRHFQEYSCERVTLGNSTAQSRGTLQNLFCRFSRFIYFFFLLRRRSCYYCRASEFTSVKRNIRNRVIHQGRSVITRERI